MILTAAVASAILLVGSIRNRTQADLRRRMAVRIRGLVDGLRRRDAGRQPLSTICCPKHCGCGLWSRGRRVPDDRPAAVHRKPVRRADRHQPAGAGRRRPSAAARAGPPRRAPTTIRSTWRRSPKRRPRASAPAACWCAWGPISTTSARCSSRATSSRTRGTTPTGTNAGAGHEHADHHRPHQRRRRPGPAAPSARADHRLHRAAPRHDAGRVFLSPGQRAQRSRPGRRRSGRKRVSLSRARSRRPKRPPC